MARALRTKRAYEPASPDDGLRVLIDRLWPRGLRRSEARIDLWLRELSPSDALRQWFGHDPTRFAEFRQRYRRELSGHEPVLADLLRKSREGPVTLVFAAKDAAHSNAAVLGELMEERLGRPPATRGPGRTVRGRPAGSERRRPSARRAGGSRRTNTR